MVISLFYPTIVLYRQCQVHICLLYTSIVMRQKAGSIINMASVVGVHGNAGQANYAASKAGMIALAKSIAQELGSRGIRANAIAPGSVSYTHLDVYKRQQQHHVHFMLSVWPGFGPETAVYQSLDSIGALFSDCLLYTSVKRIFHMMK